MKKEAPSVDTKHGVVHLGVLQQRVPLSVEGAR